MTSLEGLRKQSNTLWRKNKNVNLHADSKDHLKIAKNYEKTPSIAHNKNEKTIPEVDSNQKGILDNKKKTNLERSLICESQDFPSSPRKRNR